MFIDTHCHLTDDFFTENNLDTFIKNAADNNVKTLISACADINDVSEIIKLTEKYNNVFCTLGVHPEYAKNNNDIESIIEPALINPKVIGVGEIGLDYHYGIDDKKQQIELFSNQIEMAINANLPIAVHTRDAEDDTANILSKFNTSGVMHCFTGSWEFAKRMLDLGFYFSASGIITFKNASELRETFAKIPNDRIVIETDAPWCAPVPFRGKQCEPAFVIETAKTLAQIKNLQIDNLESILEQNTKKLYKKITI